MEIRSELMGFVTLDEAGKFNKEYAEILDMIPVGEWVRYQDILPKHYQRVGKLFKALCDINYAERREVDDGMVEIPDEIWVRDDNGEPAKIEAFDKNGRSLGIVNNPFCKWGCNGHYEKVTRKVHASHTEYFYYGERRS